MQKARTALAKMRLELDALRLSLDTFEQLLVEPEPAPEPTPRSPHDPGKVLYNTAQTAEYLSTPEGTLGNWRWKGTGPTYVRMGRRVLYRRSDLDAFIAASAS